MALANNKVTIFTDIMDTKLGETSIVPSIARGMYKGQVVEGGTVKILGTEDVTIGQYTGTISHQEIAGSAQDVAISKKPYFSIKLGADDLSQVPKNELGFLMGKASKGLALDLDTQLVALVSKAKVTVAGALATVDSAFTGLATAFDLANVGMNDRGVVLSPSICNTLVEVQGAKLSAEKASNIVYEGYIGKYMGIEIFKSNKIGSTLTVANCMGVDMSALVLAKSYENLREITSSEFFGVALQGLLVYGIDVVETETGLSDRLIAFNIDEA